jgi:type III restriction enzyme
MDSTTLGEMVHDVNILTVVANESYSDFTKALQSETAEIVADRPREVNEKLFEGNCSVLSNGGMILNELERKELWDRFYTNAPRLRTLSEKKYKNLKRV